MKIHSLLLNFNSLVLIFKSPLLIFNSLQVKIHSLLLIFNSLLLIFNSSLLIFNSLQVKIHSLLLIFNSVLLIFNSLQVKIHSPLIIFISLLLIFNSPLLIFNSLQVKIHSLLLIFNSLLLIFNSRLLIFNSLQVKIHSLVLIFNPPLLIFNSLQVKIHSLRLAMGLHGCRREYGATDLCFQGGREGGGGVRPFLFSTENSQIVAYSCSDRGGPQVLSGETRFLRIRAYPEKIGAEAPEQPQNSRQSQKLGIFLSALALAAGAKQAGGDRAAAGHLRNRRITTELLQRSYHSENYLIWICLDQSEIFKKTKGPGPSPGPH